MIKRTNRVIFLGLKFCVLKAAFPFRFPNTSGTVFNDDAKNVVVKGEVKIIPGFTVGWKLLK